MTESLKLTSGEIKRLTTGRCVNRPKYTFFALNKAVEYSGANAKSVLGNVEEIYEEFERMHSDGEFEDWKQYYFQEHQGEQRLDEATEKAFDKLLVIREAIKQIDEEDVREFIEGFALYGTYESENIQNAITTKLMQEFPGCEPLDERQNAPDVADLRYGDYYLAILSKEKKDEIDYDENIRPIFYKSTSNGISVDVSSLNTSLDEF